MPSLLIIPLIRRISRQRDPSISISSILNNWIEIGLTFKLSELHKLTKKLRRRGRFDHALQISEWMSHHRGHELSDEHFAARLDLILRVHGLEQAEEYFNNIPDTSKSYRVCIVLLIHYAYAKKLDKAEDLMQKMRDMGIILTAYAYNVMLNLYVKEGKHEKLALLAEEMEEKGIKFETEILDVHGLEQLADKYFNNIPNTSNGYRVCNILLFCYAKAKQLVEAELLLKKMRDMGIILTPYAYNEMLNLYAKEGKHEKLALLGEEMEVKGIIFNVTREIRLHAYVASGNIEGMDKFLMKINMDPEIKMSFCAYSFAAYGYLKAGLIDKAMKSLKEAERLLNDSDFERHRNLLLLYAAMGNNAEVYRVCKLYKRKIMDWCKFIHSNIVEMYMIRSLVKLGDVDGAEKILQECGFPDLEFDIRVANLMITGYSRKGCLEKAEECINKIIKGGKEPNAASWDRLATGYLLGGRMLEAVETMKKAISKSKPGLSPRLRTLAACLKYLEGQGDKEAAEELREMINEHCHLSPDECTRLSRLMEDDQICIEPPTALEFPGYWTW